MNQTFKCKSSDDAFIEEIKALKIPFDNSVLENRINRLENIISEINAIYIEAC